MSAAAQVTHAVAANADPAGPGIVRTLCGVVVPFGDGPIWRYDYEFTWPDAPALACTDCKATLVEQALLPRDR